MKSGWGETMQFHAIVRREGRYYTVEFVDAPGCQTFGEDAASAERMAQDAVEGWVEAHLVTGTALPTPKKIRRRLPRGGWWLTITIPLKIAVRAALVTQRVHMGLSQAQVAKRMKVTRQAYQQLESPDANLRLDTMTRAFDALDVAPIFSLVPRPTRARRDLRSLVRATSKQNMPPKVDWGPPRGKEVW
jgi:predicted RNase H-like HicB family nuclease/transcriptional regulator with XRE-family HTH domain